MRYLFVINTLFLFLVGCSTIEPVRHSGDRFDHSGTFTHDAFENVLQRFVDDQGFIDYASLKKDPVEIESYYFLVSTYSPQNNPALFSSKESRLAYWINAYNAAVIKAVLTHYPISSVRDVKSPFLLFFLPEESGFFLWRGLP